MSIRTLILLIAIIFGAGLAFLAALVLLGYCAKLYAQFFILGWNLGPDLFKNLL
jgi:hypothetical protein